MKHWKPTTTRGSTERGGPDPGSDLVEVARKHGQFRRVRVAAARPCAPIPLVGGGHGVRCWRLLLRLSTRAERSAWALRVGWIYWLWRWL